MSMTSEPQSGLKPDSTITPAAKTADDIVDLLNADDEPETPEGKTKPEEKEGEKGKSKEKESKDKGTKEDEFELVDDEDEDKDDKPELEDEDLEEEEKPFDEPEIDLADSHGGFKALKAKYPEIEKEFPFLRKLVFRDRAYTELFGSLDDAKEASERLKTFSEIEHGLLSGDVSDVLKSVKENDPKAYDKIIDTYVDQLSKVDKEAYYEVQSRVVKKLIYEMFNEGKTKENEDLQQAAIFINQFMGWGNSYTPPKNRAAESEEVSDEKKQLEKDRAEFIQTKFNDANQNVQTKIENILRATVDKYIDPRDAMTSYVKRNAITEVITNVYEQLNNDKEFSKTKDNLWRAAFKANFSQESLARIQKFYSEKAKLILPAHIKKVRTEALKDMPRKAKPEDDESPEPRRRVSAGTPSQRRSGNGTPQRKPGQSVSDFIMED